jgi:nitroreductase
MSTAVPDEDSIRTGLALASRAPSVRNSQPWLWKVAPHSLHLYSDPNRHRPRTEPDRDLTISCGATLHHCVVALAAQDWGSRVYRFPDPADTNHVAAIEFYSSRAADLDFVLAAATPRRRTDRRVYSCWPIAAPDIAMMAARAARVGVMLRLVESLPWLNEIVAHAAWHYTGDNHNLGESGTSSEQDRPAEDASIHDAPSSEAMAPGSGRAIDSPAEAQQGGETARDEVAVVMALSTEADDQLAHLRAGEATSLVLLTATALGMASCPVTEPLEIAATRERVRSEVLGGHSYPQMLLRIGWAPVNADPLPPTPRRPLADVASHLDGTPFG